jgi:hypothetical protein
MFHKEGISSSNSSLMKSAVFIKPDPHDNLQVTPQRKHFEQKDKASIILRSFNHQEKEVKKSVIHAVFFHIIKTEQDHVS